ncbi:hypothetical protein GQ55_7G111400 [Panicum hallii var. hallii]|uniref:Uncharacterized protein n=1 Tax=Panicum hallii var. hallii TaxID=1504633 RepID=A0A2T7CTZ7_9POAL|nr:hypothetical protein GQ55_7G111400 [Panicum hallii var. hallii]PUZ46799.1 hypothetical protein GQ55_7G111400 [Panicum hallii var. hallii]
MDRIRHSASPDSILFSLNPTSSPMRRHCPFQHRHLLPASSFRPPRGKSMEFEPNKGAGMGDSFLLRPFLTGLVAPHGGVMRTGSHASDRRLCSTSPASPRSGLPPANSGQRLLGPATWQQRLRKSGPRLPARRHHAAARGDGADPYHRSGGAALPGSLLFCTRLSPPLCAIGKALGGPPPLTANKGSALSRRASGRASSAGVIYVRLSNSMTKPLACITPSPKSVVTDGSYTAVVPTISPTLNQHTQNRARKRLVCVGNSYLAV